MVTSAHCISVMITPHSILGVNIIIIFDLSICSGKSRNIQASGQSFQLGQHYIPGRTGLIAWAKSLSPIFDRRCTEEELGVGVKIINCIHLTVAVYHFKI